MKTTINETECVLTHEGKAFAARGAYVDGERASVYVTVHQRYPKPIDRNALPWLIRGATLSATTWNATEIGTGHIKSAWFQYTKHGRYLMASVRFTINGVTYAGRFNWDNSQLVHARKVASN